MIDDITQNPTSNGASSQVLQRQGLIREKTADTQTRQAMQMRSAGGIQCPHCGAMNEPEAMFCASCGEPIGSATCPYCGAAVDPDADFCESCRHYIRKDVCSFCGAHLGEQEAFCPECGSPRGGIVCPVCHTLNDFSFCKQCGTPLTEEARLMLEKVKQMPEFIEMQRLANEIEKLNMSLPYGSEQDKAHIERNNKLRERVLTLLAQDRGIANPIIPEPTQKRMSVDEYETKKQARLNKLAELLEQMAQKPQPKPVQVRNYAMACKPQGVRLAWECNFKHALHSSPCGCAKPQMGGKWIILGKNSKQEIKDDN